MLYENRDTGELLTYKEMRQHWATEYDGDDPTNALDWREQYREVKDNENKED